MTDTQNQTPDSDDQTPDQTKTIESDNYDFLNLPDQDWDPRFDNDAAPDSHIISHDSCIAPMGMFYEDDESGLFDDDLSSEKQTPQDKALYASAANYTYEKTPEEQAAIDAQNIAEILKTENAETFEELMYKLQGRPVLVNLSDEDKNYLEEGIQASQEILMKSVIAEKLAELSENEKEIAGPQIKAEMDAIMQNNILTQIASLYGQTKDEYLASKAQAENTNNDPKP